MVPLGKAREPLAEELSPTNCAEQIASVATSTIEASTVEKHNESMVPKICNFNPEKGITIDVVPSVENYRDTQPIDIDSKYSLIEKEIVFMPESRESVNNFYTHDRINDITFGQKSCGHTYTDFDEVSSTMYNNISQNSTQEQQNASSDSKDGDRYDKKLNQPNFKPSISNVFNSLNEYINAPTGSLNYIEPILDKDDLFERSIDDAVEKDFKSNRDVVINELSSISTEKGIINVIDENILDYKNILPVELNKFVKVEINNKQDNTMQNIMFHHPISVQSEENNSIISAPNTAISNHNDVIDTELSSNKSDKKVIANDTFEENSDRFISKQKQLDLNKRNFIDKYTFVENKESIVENKKLDKNITSNENQDNNIKTTKSDIFSNVRMIRTIDTSDFSEEELNQYLLELEKEERSKTDNISLSDNTWLLQSYELREDREKNVNHCQRDDEDVNEAPIFEKIMIGELPKISQEEFQKTKKFPVIDYNTDIYHENIVDVKCNNIVKFDLKSNQLKYTKSNELDKTIIDNHVTEIIGQDVAIQENTLQTCIAVQEKISSKFENIGEQLCSNNMIQKLQQDFNRDILSQDCNSDILLNLSEKIKDHEKKVYQDVTENNKDVFVVHETSVYNNENISKMESVSKISDTHTRGNDQEFEKPIRPQTLDIVLTHDKNDSHTFESSSTAPEVPEHSEIGIVDEDRGASSDVSDNSLVECNTVLGKQPPFWVPDSDAPSCMLCDVKFTVLKRRHHCRACGKVLCNKCCNMKYRLEYQGNIDSRVCVSCFHLLIKAGNEQGIGDWSASYNSNTDCGDVNSVQERQPNPNNPMEYCSTVPPLQQLAGGLPPPPAVMVPVGVLKREGSKHRTEGQKSVIFSDGDGDEGRKNCLNELKIWSSLKREHTRRRESTQYCSEIQDLLLGVYRVPEKPSERGPSTVGCWAPGIRPGCDLTELDTCWDPKLSYRKQGNKRIFASGSVLMDTAMRRQNHPPLDSTTNSYIPHDSNLFPPTVTIHKGQIIYHPPMDESVLYKTLKNECEPSVMFAINHNLYAYVKITNLNCCVNKICWNVTSRGLACIGQDEIILLVEVLPDETRIPKDLLIYINQLYLEAIKGNTVTELGFSVYQNTNLLLGSREHVGFLFIRQTLQCLQKIILPPAPFLIGLLIHRWETPWAKMFPLRLLLRLGAEYRYYPCPLVSVRFRNALYFEIGHTVMKVLADFRNFGYTLPGVRGLTIHLKNRTTDVMFPRNRYDQVIKGLHNSNDHVLAYASNFSITADSHLVCIQTNTGDESSYQTQAINIHNKPRTVTGASFIVINGALKSSMGLSAKSSIVEDGLMVEIMPEKMEALKAALKNMQDFSIGCGRQGALEPDEVVNIKWVDNDMLFNLGVKSPIDGQLMDGIPSIRVHNGIDYKGATRFIRWTEVFIIKKNSSVEICLFLLRFEENCKKVMRKCKMKSTFCMLSYFTQKTKQKRIYLYYQDFFLNLSPRSQNDHSSGVNDPVDINKLSGSIAKATCAALVKLLDLLATAGLTKLGVRTTIHPDNVGYEAGSEGTKLPPIYMKSLDNELIQVLHKAVQSSQDAYTVLELIFYVLED
ncbi:Zinc finger FYVE domain-containing protein 9 [Atta colombica]|uniref:Zinc finger FYVE domain-containing protein 9 n=1 Tax=Atta colombica TaxID=520822 RepID=A0A195BHP1_9HYME|nr:Zinc finger FYVE domain-containing protein 9 [Atta colombica]